MTTAVQELEERDHDNETCLLSLKGAVIWWGVLLGMSGCTSLGPLPSSSTYWEAKEVAYSQVITDYNACKMWSTVKYAESEKKRKSSQTGWATGSTSLF